jgi:Protein of unknown function (DUF2846).
MKKSIIFLLGILLALSSYSQETTGTTEELSVDENYVLLHIYRKNSLAGSAIKYNVHLDDTIICRAGNKWKETIKIEKEGLFTLWAKTETKTELSVEIEFGKEYYIRCGVKIGVVAGRPKIELVDNETGKNEFESIQMKSKKK